MKRARFLGTAGAAVAATAIPRATRASESEIALSTPSATLFGTLVIPPKMPAPVVLIIAGSGPVDRNGNSGRGFTPNTYALLADALAQRGVASLRYDKRGIGDSAFFAATEKDLRLDMYVDDAIAWMRWLDSDKRLSGVTVAGHSEGSLMGILAAQKRRAKAFVSLEGAGRPAPVVLREQLKRRLTPDLYAKADAVIAQLQQGRTADDPPPELDMLFRPSVQPYLISWFKYDPAAEIAKLKTSTTIVQGTADIQLTMDDANALNQAKPGSTLVVVEGMNHVLKHAPDTSSQAAIAKGYTDASLPVEPRVIDGVYNAAATA